MRRFATVLSRSIALLFSILFILSLVLVLVLVDIQFVFLNAETYKHALLEHNVYEQLPALMAEDSSAIKRFLGDSCKETPLVCAMKDSSSALRSCLMDALGEAAYLRIESGQRVSTAAELQSSQPCLDQDPEPETGPAAGWAGDNLISTALPEVQTCARQALGDETYQILYNGQRSPTTRETRRINACIRESRRNERANNPGIGGDLMPILEDFSPEQWEELINYLLPVGDLQRMTESGLDQVFAYVNGKTDIASVSLASLKKRLTGQSGDELILLLLQAQPACTAEELTQINSGNFENGGGTAIYCAVPEEALPLVMPAMRQRLEKVASRIPDEVVLTKPGSATAGTKSPFGEDPLKSARTIRNWMQYIPLLPLTLLLLITVFSVRSFKGLLRALGIPLLIAGLLGLSIGFAAGPLLEGTWVQYAISRIAPMISGGISQLVHSLARSITHEMGKWLMMEAGIATMLGLAAIILASHVGTKPAKTARSFTPPELAPRPEPPKEGLPRTRDESGYS
jgi:hypothetical protein